VSLCIPAGDPPGAGLHRVLNDLAVQALRDAEGLDGDFKVRTHAIRTGMKKFRALLRLAKPVIGASRREKLGRSIAEMKHALSAARDQVVVAAIAGEVLGKDAGNPDPAPEVHRDVLVKIATTLEQYTRDLDLHELEASALRTQWKRTRRRVRKSGKRARKSGAAEDFHRWRKRVKDLWYQSEALGALRDEAAAMVEPAKALSGILGREHDLTLAMDALDDLSKSDRRKLAKRREKCRRKALAIGRKL
jgi:Uncharacterized conserved protein